jgi:DNA-directed RNA polymerase specialized sigma24 family protein
LKTWLFRLAHHRLSNQRRRWRTHLDELPDASPDDLVNVLSLSEDQQPDHQFEKSVMVKALKKCLAGLTEVQRAVVVGQYYEGITLEDMTKNLNLTNKSGARASLIAAQRKLRRCMEKSGMVPEL